MRGVLRVFLDGFQRLRGSLVGWVVIAGLVLLPCLFTWVNILAFWDPAANTGSLKVAVANEDAGYTASVAPVTVSAGGEIVDDLRSNRDFDWQFTTASEALAGVRSGEYYAAVVIPEGFSARLAGVLTGGDQQAQIQYYVNEKLNPVASHVTSIGMGDLREEVSESFQATVSRVALEALGDLSGDAENGGLMTYGRELADRLSGAATQLGNDAALARTFAALLGQAKALTSASADGLGQAQALSEAAAPVAGDAASALGSARATLSDGESLAGSGLGGAASSLAALRTSVDRAFGDASGDPAALVETLGALRADLQALDDAYGAAVAAVGAADPDNAALAALQQAQQAVQAAERGLSAATAAAQDAAGVPAEQRAAALGAIDAAIAAVQALQEEAARAAGASLDAGLGSFGEDVQAALSQLKAAASPLATAGRDTADALGDVHDALLSAAATLEDAAATVRDGAARLSMALDSKDLAEARKLIGTDAGGLARLIAAPVRVDKRAVYAVANNGSAMAPFYSSMGLFIGALFSVIILRDKLAARLDGVRPWQAYVGTWLFFVAVAEAQALLMATGNVFFVQVQCDHLGLCYLAFCLTGLAFSSIAFGLTAAFGDLGKAATLLLLVIQIGGSGGQMPVQLSMPFFQALYPWLPFTHSMGCMQGAIAGVYGGDFLVNAGCLLGFVAGGAVLVLAVRPLAARTGDWIRAQLARTGMM